MTKTKTRTRWFALMLAVIMAFGLVPQSAFAGSIGDGSATATVSLGNRNYFLKTTAGTSLGVSTYQYTTNDGLTGPGFCLNHGLDYTARRLPISGKYTASPQAAGAVANGYPQHSLDTFLGLYLNTNSILNGLTEDEYAYATQVTYN